MKKFFIIASLCFFCITGCTDYTETRYGSLDKAFILNSSPTFRGYYYIGSDKKYHYFVSKWRFKQDEEFKLPVDKLSINNEYKFALNKGEIAISLINQGIDTFGQNEFYTLYIKKVSR
jgi:hypothetical protein